jgi:hypothetical protein
MNERAPFYRRPWPQIVMAAFISLGIYLLAIYELGGWLNNLFDVIWDTLVCFLGFFLWIVFFAQFILPVHSISERFRIFDRVMLYLVEHVFGGLLGRHGPAIFIENGRILAGENELQKRGPGVIWLDTASAAVLRNATAYTRPVGPGVVFTHNGEYVAGAMDLHPMSQAIGPEGEESPFAPKQGDQPDFEKIQERRWSTSAMTRDGIEVVATLSVTIRTDDLQNDSKSRFVYNAKAVYNYITTNIKPDTNVMEPVWSKLPAQLVVDLWREYLRKYTLSQLFEIPTGQMENQNVMQWIEKSINERLSLSEVDELDEFGNRTGRKIPSRENTQLREMGLKAGASIRGLYFKPEVEDRLVSQWPATWLHNAQRERELIEQQLNVQDKLGQDDARREFAAEASRAFSRSVPKDAWSALEMFLQGTLQGVIRHPDLSQWTTGEAREISEMIQWLREEKRE